jgi:Zn-dependent M32 family carboxypeptidase
MADALRIYDAVSSEKIMHMTVIYYHQNDATNTKNIVEIIEVDLTNSCNLLFGTLTRSQIEELVNAVKSVPQKRKPTEEEYKKMYSIRDSLQILSSAIHLDIKCNSTQSRLQCSFNHFQKFIEDNPIRVIEKSNTNEFRGGVISSQIVSSRRVFKKNRN